MHTAKSKQGIKLAEPKTQYAQNAEEELQRALQSNPSLMSAAAGWAVKSGAVSPWHINCIIANGLASIPYLNNIEMFFDISKPDSVDCVAKVGLWTLISRKKVERIRQLLTEICTGYLPYHKPTIYVRYGN